MATDAQDVKLIEQTKKYKYKENDPEYKGNKPDENLRNGIIENRHCTDLLMCLLFIGLWVGMVIVASYSYKHGDYKRISCPYDSLANQCGVGNATAFPYLYYTNPGVNLDSVCVKKCPQVIESTSKVQSFTPISAVNTTKTFLLVTLCMPSDNKQLNSLYKYIGMDQYSKYFNDLKTAWPILLASLFIAFGLSFIILNLLKYFIKPIIWLQIILIFVLFALGAFFSLKNYMNMKNQIDKKNQSYYWLAGGIIFSILTFVYIILFCCFRQKIRLCIEIMDQAADFINDVCQIILVPVGVFVYTVLFMAFWLSVTLYVYTQGTSHYKKYYPYGGMTWDNGVKRQLGFQIFALIWNIEAIIAFFYFVVSSACALWYFSEKCNNTMPVDRPISRSIYRAFRYHLGTIAFGSIVLSFIWVIRILAAIIHDQIKDKTDKNTNCLINFICGCCACYLDCFERFIRFLNQKAYIMTSITGKGFCDSAHEAFYIVLRNPIRFASLNYVGAVFIMVGQVCIVGFTVFVCYLIFQHTQYYIDNLFSVVLPLVFVGISAYLVSSIFMGIHGIAADTILYCFCLDEEIHNSNGQGPQYSPNKLHEFFKSQNM